MRTPRRFPAAAIAAALVAVALWANPGSVHGDDAAPIVFGGSAAYPPHQWLDEDGAPRGFLIDLQEAMGAAGCDCIQGFYYARPVPGDELLALIGNAQHKTGLESTE